MKTIPNDIIPPFYYFENGATNSRFTRART